MTIEIKAIEQYFSVALFSMLRKVVLTGKMREKGSIFCYLAARLSEKKKF